ncbi:MAG: glucosaminidase domain-containing protein [Pseudomonadota bacterium]|nr:glucosaminidase domain-containing protein [Pseudomonadota bacterium]
MQHEPDPIPQAIPRLSALMMLMATATMVYAIAPHPGKSPDALEMPSDHQSPTRPEPVPTVRATQRVLASAPQKTPRFAALTSTRQRKALFFAYLYGHIKHVNTDLLSDRARLRRLSEQATLSGHDLKWLNALAHRYKLGTVDWNDHQAWNQLMMRVDMVPPSIALAQAANESAWGTSRFAREGNNYFGQYCYRPGCGLTPAARPEDARYQLARYPSAAASVRSYIHNLNTHRAYETFRAERRRLRNAGQFLSGPALAPGLSRYSERSSAYIRDILRLIRDNKLVEYDAMRWCLDGHSLACPIAGNWAA